MTNVMKELSQRQKILNYLQSHRGASSAEISRALRITSANTRRHLNILILEKRVKKIGLRTRSSSGRPCSVFESVDTSAEAQMTRLTEVLLDHINSQTSPADRMKNMIEISNGMISDCSISGSSINFTHLIAETVGHFNAMGYQARWEAHSVSPRIIFEQCPYQTIIHNHPELCLMDAAMLKGLIGRDTEQVAKLEKNARGIPFCLFYLT